MKLAEIQAAIKAPKGQFNNFGKYKYRSCEDIVEAVKPVINPMGYSLILTDEVVLIGNRHYIKSTASLFDGVLEKMSAVGWAREADDKKGMDAAQITGSASSYARKYALNGLFAIDDTKDSDHINNGEIEKKVVQKKKEDESELYDIWQDNINMCNNETDLMRLWESNKETCANDQRIKDMFSIKKNNFVKKNKNVQQGTA